MCTIKSILSIIYLLYNCFRYVVGKIYKKDCSECICKLGGVEHCTPQKCAACEEVTVHVSQFKFYK